MKPRFKRGDFVRIVDDLGPTMSHFRAGANAIILHSDVDMNPFISESIYSPQYQLIFTDTGNEVAWYEEDQLILMQPHPDNVIDIIRLFYDQIREYQHRIKKLEKS
ncbi:hypothetical protein GQ473_02035 [archaeon]|nr:hypothetical protein [archaeon]